MTIRIIKFIINSYHILFPSTVRVCRYDPTCSKYFIDAVTRYGFLTGSFNGIKRILSCHPFSQRPLIDPA